MGKKATPRTKGSGGKDKRSADSKDKKPRAKKSSTSTDTLHGGPKTCVTRTRSISNTSVMGENQQLVTDFVKATLEKTPEMLREEFAKHKRTADKDKTVAFLNNQPKNRYKDVPCLDNDRVLLQGGDSDYIHANYVSTPKDQRRFICCQAPIKDTLADHWKMIVQQDVESILMLCNYIEGPIEKCAAYFPTKKEPEMTFGPFTIKLIKLEKLKLPDCETSAKIMASSLEVKQDGVKVKDVKHYHWVDWPDRGVPPIDQAPIRLLNLITTTTKPILVHCSAGVGRTGAVVVVQYALESIEKGQPVQQMDTLMLKVREQRANSVQNDAQYVYVHMLLLNYFQKDTFTPAYNKFAKAAEIKLSAPAKK
ncbi:unnamed protein product, partial [Mesorhabditis spiculigera]